MTEVAYTPEEQRIYDRNTYHGPLPQRSDPPKAVEPTRHPLAGNRPGVRSTSRKALKTVKLSDDEHQVYIALKMHDRSLCDAELLAYLKASTTKGDKWEINQVTGRRHSLLTKGLIEEHNRRVQSLNDCGDYPLGGGGGCAMTDSFTCAHCGKTFQTMWSDEEASLEFDQRFDGADISTAQVVCDDCYKQVMGDAA